MKANDISIDVKANLKVDKRTAYSCLKLVEIYCNDVGANIVASKDVDGAILFDFTYRGVAENRND